MIFDPAFQRIRALKMLDLKLHNYNNTEIAKEFNVHPRTVERALTALKRSGIILDAEDHLLSEMLPKAQKVILRALDDLENPDVGLALKIFDKIVKGRDAKKGEGSVEEDELASYIKRKRLEAQADEDTLEGQLVAAPEQLEASQTGDESGTNPVGSASGDAHATQATASEDRQPDSEDGADQHINPS